MVLCIWSIAVVHTVVSAVVRLRRRGHLGTWFANPVVATDGVPAADVHAAIESTDDRVAAIKALRELHPGLELMAAHGLVNDLMDGDYGS